jgi:hypothetical protein
MYPACHVHPAALFSQPEPRGSVCASFGRVLAFFSVFFYICLVIVRVYWTPFLGMFKQGHSPNIFQGPWKHFFRYQQKGRELRVKYIWATQQKNSCFSLAFFLDPPSTLIPEKFEGSHTQKKIVLAFKFFVWRQLSLERVEINFICTWPEGRKKRQNVRS